MKSVQHKQQSISWRMSWPKSNSEVEEVHHLHDPVEGKEAVRIRRGDTTILR
jgi:hypothetical protein